MLAFKANDIWERWTGQLIGDTQYGAIIETAWDDDELAAIGLFRVDDPGIPPGKVATSLGLVDVGGTPTIAYTLTDLLIDGSAVDTERERRIALPLIVAVPSGATFPINMDPNAQRNIQGLATAGILLNATAPTQETSFRDYDNQTHALLPGDLIAMGLQVMARIQTVYQKSWALKALAPIPADFADDSHWS